MVFLVGNLTVADDTLFSIDSDLTSAMRCAYGIRVLKAACGHNGVCFYLLPRSAYFSRTRGFTKMGTYRAFQTFRKLEISTSRNDARNPDIAASAIHNVQSIVAKWTEMFQSKKIPEPKTSAELIVAYVIGHKTVSSRSLVLYWCLLFVSFIRYRFVSIQLDGIPPWQILSIEKTDKINSLCTLRLQR